MEFKNGLLGCLLFVNLFCIVYMTRSVYDKVEVVEQKVDNVSVKCDTLQSEVNLLNCYLYD